MKISIVPQPGMIGPRYGGYNKRMYYLSRELSKLGHKVKIFALPPGSQTDGANLISDIPFGERPYIYRLETKQHFIAEAINRSQDADIINCQTDHLGLIFDRFSKVPIVHTLITSNLPDIAVHMLKLYKNLNYSAVSSAPKNKFNFLKFKGVVYNGCDVENFQFNEKPKDYFLVLSRLSKDKGIHRAALAAKKLNIKLNIAGKCMDENYCKNIIKPLLGDGIKYIGSFGPLRFEEKIKTIQNAKAVFSLSESDEGFSNTILESLSCGTPVIAWDQFSYREIIKSGKNGFIVKNKRELYHAIKHIDEIDRKKCRETVLKKYTYRHMAQGYEKLFKKILKK